VKVFIYLVHQGVSDMVKRHFKYVLICILFVVMIIISSTQCGKNETSKGVNSMDQSVAETENKSAFEYNK